MAIVGSFSRAVALLQRETVLVVVLVVANLPLAYLDQLSLLVGAPWGFVGVLVGAVVAPALVGGMYEVADEVDEGGSADAGVFIRGVAENYESLLGATAAFALGLFVVGVAVLLLLVMVPGLLNLVVILLGVGALFAAVLFQFVNVSIVVDGETALSAYERSYLVAKRRTGAVLGYVLMRAVVALVFVMPLAFLVLTRAQSTAETGSVTLGPAGAAAIAVSALSAAVLYPAHVVFFKAVGDVRWDEEYTERYAPPPAEP